MFSLALANSYKLTVNLARLAVLKLVLIGSIGAVIVSTPQDVALIDVRKGTSMFRKVGIPVSLFVCKRSLLSRGADTGRCTEHVTLPVSLVHGRSPHLWIRRLLQHRHEGYGSRQISRHSARIGDKQTRRRRQTYCAITVCDERCFYRSRAQSMGANMIDALVKTFCK